MNNIYLPIENVNDFACYSVLDKDTIRAYRTLEHSLEKAIFGNFFQLSNPAFKAFKP